MLITYSHPTPSVDVLLTVHIHLAHLQPDVQSSKSGKPFCIQAWPGYTRRMQCNIPTRTTQPINVIQFLLAHRCR